MHLLRLNFAVIQLFNYFWSPRAKKKTYLEHFFPSPFLSLFCQGQIDFFKIFFLCVCV